MSTLTVVPRATYRLQVTPEFGFEKVAQLADYLQELGISHAYLSPILTAAPGSQHGYDVIDHRKVDAELGGAPAHARMCDALRSHGLGQLVDIVPNHMAVCTDNSMWWDVLENGPSSDFAAFFDVEWGGDDDAKRRKDARILLPILGEHYIDALQQRLVRVSRRPEGFVVEYHDHKMPAAPRSLGDLLSAAADDHEELSFLADALKDLPAPTATDRKATSRRQRDKTVLFEYLQNLLVRDPALAKRIDAEIELRNHDVERLDAWLEQQNWRLAHWRTATTELGYRRFFDVNSLAGLRIEDPHVFHTVHRLVFEWLGRGTIDGVRVDHVDGLRDPEQYLQRLRHAAPHSWIVVEKILAERETLPAQWPIEGTTGYEFIRACDQVFVDSGHRAQLEALAEKFGGDTGPWEQQVQDAKTQILKEVLTSERERLIDLAARALSNRIELRDCTRRTVATAMTALLVSYPVYRTYVRVGPTSETSYQVLKKVVDAARAQLSEVDPRVFDALEQILSLHSNGEAETELALRVQQLTGAVTAKAIEDTLFYRHTRLCALNEVGGTPEIFGISPAEFHEVCRIQNTPRGLLASATHDTKRGEDTRSRMLALSELPDQWARAVTRWAQRCQRHRSLLLDAPTEYFFYQTWVGAYPLSEERAVAYMQKAMREAKRHTSWIQPNPEYESAVEEFVRAALSDRELAADVATFVGSIARGAYMTSLARTLLKLTAPGVPDVYQGTELWDFSLVDPDNRRAVDYAQRRALLARIKELRPEAVMSELESGAPKLWLIWKTLQLRSQQPELFDGPYTPLFASGPHGDHVLSYGRGDRLIVAVPRLNARLDPGQRDAELTLPDGRYQNVLTGEPVNGTTITAAQLWRSFPVALLVRQP